ncbi:hypothetical protein [Bacillus thuringiensis]|uniref:hypothetical protein n=1 Tax=Bacillus thuringiensis TaxID=1428 RepID=UPI001643004C|nr:hypothetical protein [Bacillus thuringiensis]
MTYFYTYLGCTPDWSEKLEVVTSQQIQNGVVFTDNHAPTEWLTDSMIFSEANTCD